MEYPVVFARNFERIYHFREPIQLKVASEQMVFNGRKPNDALGCLAILLSLAALYVCIFLGPIVFDPLLPITPMRNLIRAVLALTCAGALIVLIWKCVNRPVPARVVVNVKDVTGIAAHGRAISMQLANRAKASWQRFYLFTENCATAEQVVMALRSPSREEVSCPISTQPIARDKRVINLLSSGMVRIDESMVTLEGASFPSKYLTISIFVFAALIYFFLPQSLFGIIVGPWKVFIVMIALFIMYYLMINRKLRTVSVPISSISQIERFGAVVLFATYTRHEKACYVYCLHDEEQKALEMEQALYRLCDIRQPA